MAKKQNMGKQRLAQLVSGAQTQMISYLSVDINFPVRCKKEAMCDWTKQKRTKDSVLKGSTLELGEM